MRLAFPALGAMVCLGLAVWAGAETVAAADPAPSATFFRAYNLNGPAVTIDGRLWEGRESKTYQTADSAFENQSVPLIPATEPERALMIRSSRWGGNFRVTLTDVDAGEYQVGVYIWEDNNSETFAVGLQGVDVAKDVQSGSAGEWRRLGPYPVRVGEDRSITLTARGGAANISGIEISRGLGPIPEVGRPEVVELPAISAQAAAHFRTQIAPLLAKHCLACHNSSEPRGELDLSQWTAAMRGGESGPVIVPGQPDASLVWTHVESDEMPQKRPPLSGVEKATLRDWIAAGAPWADRSIDALAYTTDRRAGYDWWSLQPVHVVDPPPVQTAGWIRNEVDHFILARLADAGLSPAAEADRRTLIRRVTFDLIGLPPTPEEVEAFVADDLDRDAYERLVDRLLASPHYGERWGAALARCRPLRRVARASNANHIRQNAWRYRDWVIDAFNRDLPYDEFVRQQLAGDVLHPDDLGALIATGYHVCGTWDMVAASGRDQARCRRRTGRITSKTSSAHVGQAFLGLTLELRPLPRPQVRPDPAAGLLPVRRAARRRAAAGARAVRDQAGSPRRPTGGAGVRRRCACADVRCNPRRRSCSRGGTIGSRAMSSSRRDSRRSNRRVSPPTSGCHLMRRRRSVAASWPSG